jgi:hypothetical protein
MGGEDGTGNPANERTEDRTTMAGSSSQNGKKTDGKPVDKNQKSEEATVGSDTRWMGTGRK